MRLYYQAAFTLIELVAVLVIVGILAATILIRITPSDVDLQSAKNDVMAALVFARETAMARSDGTSSVTVVITEALVGAVLETSIDVRVNNSSINNIHQNYPLVLPKTVTVTPANQQILFTTLGETAAELITLEDNEIEVTINVSGVGYAY